MVNNSSNDGSDREGSSPPSSSSSSEQEKAGESLSILAGYTILVLTRSGKYVEMYKRDPHENPGIKPIRKGAVGYTLMVEELGRRKLQNGWKRLIMLSNRLSMSWQKEVVMQRKLKNMENNELNFEGHRPRMRRYAHGLRKLVRIGKGPEALLRQTSNLGDEHVKSYGDFKGDVGDAVEDHQWKCVHTVNGIRIFEDVADGKKRKEDVLVKSVGVVDAHMDTVFEMVLSLDRRKRYEWDMMTSDLELVDSLNGHNDVVYGTDFVFSRQWFRGQDDGAYTILQFPAIHKRNLQDLATGELTLLLRREIKSARLCITFRCSKMSLAGVNGKSISIQHLRRPFRDALLCQVAGLREYFEANPSPTYASSTTTVQSESSTSSGSYSEFLDGDESDQFYDAIAADETSSSDDDEDSDNDVENVSWAIARLALKRNTAPSSDKELDAGISPVIVGKDDTDADCWTSPGRPRVYDKRADLFKRFFQDNEGIPLLKLLAVDWFKSDAKIDKIAAHSRCLVQSEAAKKLPFILVINLQVPAKPNYSLIMCYAADRPIKQDSLLGKFVDGSDTFRDSRFKLIPSIKEGYWMVKRAVGTKSLLIGESSDLSMWILVHPRFARSIINLVLGYVTSLVVDLAILLEAKEENELPEYILGTVRLNRLKPESAVDFEAS
ncbi:hypothetical protein MKW92_047675 [Papaver armeniacum]|nr:hypothetical protein MKW92_047675 [Papaver armeniacum]